MEVNASFIRPMGVPESIRMQTSSGSVLASESKQLGSQDKAETELDFEDVRRKWEQWIGDALLTN